MPIRHGGVRGGVRRCAPGRVSDEHGVEAARNEIPCSLAANVSHALITANVDGTHRRLFAVDMRGAGVRPHEAEWFARCLSDVVSSPVDFADASAVAVGHEGWYVSHGAVPSSARMRGLARPIERTPCSGKKLVETSAPRPMGRRVCGRCPAASLPRR
jgi:hypothetical protein